MRKLGLLTTSLLLTMSLFLYSRYFLEPVSNSQNAQLNRVEMADATGVGEALPTK